MYKAAALCAQVPYVSNPGALAAAPPASVTQRRQRLLLFRGALSKKDLAAGVGQAIRGAMQQLQSSSNETLIEDVRREATAKKAGAPKTSHAVRRGGAQLDLVFTEGDYSAYGAAMAEADFCLVPAGDSEVRMLG